MGAMYIEVPGYSLHEKVSENKTFSVYRGQRLQDKKAVLIKVVNQPFPPIKSLAPLWQEFEILRLLDFTGVENACALENHQQWWMIVLEDFGGRPLDQLGLAGRMEPEEFLKFALQLAGIVQEIHARQVIHKYIAPFNIFYNPSTRQARLANFGYASLVAKEKVRPTHAYQFTGFLPYTSPELTGRMNRTVDYRADYYSLGATLYELLTGTPPFQGESPLDLIYAHLAIFPEPPASRIKPWTASPAAFQVLSAILLKLLAKNPEERYHTPGALQADLLHCLSILQGDPQARLESQEFVPGISDRLSDVSTSQMIVGREQETGMLLESFNRTVGGSRELLLVIGEAGVGKTTLVNQLVGPVFARSGYFLSAKYDQVPQRNVYQVLTDLLAALCELILSEPEASFREWQGRLQAAVGPYGQLLTDLCPQLEKVIGRQLPAEPIDEESARHRFHQVVIRFLGGVCRADHPLVIFLDDLQWITPDSLPLWQSVLSTPLLQNLLVVGAFRGDDVRPRHLIHGLERDLEMSGGRITRLRLKNLDWLALQKLIAEALASDPADISELATLVFLKTEGNPYFSNEILKSLHKDQLLSFDPRDQKWRWDPNRIEEFSAASNVVDLFVHEINNLDRETQKILQYAACIGRRFDTAILLAILGEDNAEKLAYGLWQAMMEGLIYPLDENYRFLAIDDREEFNVERGVRLPRLADLLEEEIVLEFQHDRVQQAVLAMLDERQRSQASLRIGSMLLEKSERTGQAALQENLTTIVNHLNAGRMLVEDPLEALKMAQLNLMASNQARAVAAFETASNYLSNGMQLLPENSWQDHYTLTFELFTSAAEVALLNGDLARAEALALAVEAHARTILDKARVMKTCMDLYLIRVQLEQAVELGLAAIEMFGFNLEGREPLTSIRQQITRLPEMTDPHALALCRLAEMLTAAAFASMNAHFVQIVQFFIDLYTRFGNPPGASFIYMAYAMILIHQDEQLEQGCSIGKIALEMAEKEGSAKTLTTVRFVYYAFIHHWMAPARTAIQALHDNIQPALEAGNLLFSLNTQDLELGNALLVGQKLDQMQLKLVEAVGRIETFYQMAVTQRLKIWSAFVSRLTGDLQEAGSSLLSKDEGQAQKEIGPNRNYLFYWYVAQATLSLLFREPLTAIKYSASAEALKQSTGSHLIYAHYHFVYSLALCSSGLEDGNRAARLEKVEEILRLMRLWAARVPENFLHQVELVEAELARCLGKHDQAAAGYERAIQQARENGYIHDSALAAELAAEFYLAKGDTAAAVDHLFSAYYAYLAWGAIAKVENLAKRYPQWLPAGQPESNRLDIYAAAEDYPPGEIGTFIDLNSILKASLELAYETNLRALLHKLMAILIRNAGARNGALILCLDGRWYLEVQGSNGPDLDFVLSSIPLEDQASQTGGPLVPISIIQYVINSEVDLVLEDATASAQFRQDPYIQNRRPKSVLCAPLHNQGILCGVVYLENNLATGAFTAERLQIVQLISGQAAVLIEKARLYENLEALVEERTRALSNANRKLQEEIDERIRAEEALRYNEALLRIVLEVLPVGVWIVDKTTKIISTNPEGARIWGGARFVERPGYSEYKAWRTDSGKQIMAEEWSGGLAVTQGLTTLNEEIDIEAFDGVRRTILNSAIPLINETDGLLGAIVVNQDITERKGYEEKLQKANDQLSTLLRISQSIVSTLDLDQLLNLIIDQLGKVLPYEGAAILIPDQGLLEFRIIRGPSVFLNLAKYKIPVNEPVLVEPLIKEREAVYIQDLQTEERLGRIQDTIKILFDEFAFLRSWLGIPLVARDELVGILVLTHSQPDFYSEPERKMFQAYANQVAIAIQNARLYEHAQEVAALKERNRLARELHDSVAQALYSISLFTDATRMALNLNKLDVVRDHLEELGTLSKEAMSDMRLMIFELRPPVLKSAGLAGALQSRLESVESRAGLHPEFQMDGEFKLTEDREGELYRIAQEALNNVIKHARANRVLVRLSGEAGSFRMTIQDNGKGFELTEAEQAGGQGLRNIRERAEAIGAACRIESAPGEGTKITIEGKS